MRNTASQLVDSIGRPMPQQLDLFGAVLSSYLDGDEHTNDALYESLAQGGRLSHADLQAREPVGKDGARHCLAKVRARWHQQTLKRLGVLERVPGSRGTWRIAERDKNDLTKAPPKVVMLGFSTDLGLALWDSCFDVFGAQTNEIAVCITSPYAVARSHRVPRSSPTSGGPLGVIGPLVLALRRCWKSRRDRTPSVRSADATSMQAPGARQCLNRHPARQLTLCLLSI